MFSHSSVLAILLYPPPPPTRPSPPSQGVQVVRIKDAKAVKRPMAFRLVSQHQCALHPLGPAGASALDASHCTTTHAGVEDPAVTPHQNPPAVTPQHHLRALLSVWEPVPPPGFVALGCVVGVSACAGGRAVQPPLSSVVCLARPAVTPTHVRDCVAWSPRR